MNIVYNSENYYVVEYPMQHGYEVVDKQTSRGTYFQGDVAEKFRESMIGALRAIDRWVTRTQFQHSPQDALATMKISGQAGGVMSLFATHPPIEVRIAALEHL